MFMALRARPRRALPAVLLLTFLLTPSAAAMNESCADVDTSLGEERKQQYARLIADAVGRDVQPEQVEIMKYMQSGNWSAVYASTPETDPGVLFFENAGSQPQFKEVWGGAADPSDTEQLVTWAKNLGAPDALARCFAETVAG